MDLPITSTMAACLALLGLILTIHISARRAMIGVKAGVIHKAVFGDTGDEMLRNSVRAFGNFIEYAPFAVVLIALMELQGAPATLLCWLGGAFVIGRIVHAFSMTFVPLVPAPRGVAMFTTYAVFAVPAWWFLTN
ncbi:MAPEG family protein [Parasphingorhabdus sp.]|uniref:MAPEG family protein n=1 Tax=Parasphingorhabdus sp. TaxID=2709688 RepID=UPI003262EAE1